MGIERRQNRFAVCLRGVDKPPIEGLCRRGLSGHGNRREFDPYSRIFGEIEGPSFLTIEIAGCRNVQALLASVGKKHRIRGLEAEPCTESSVTKTAAVEADVTDISPVLDAFPKKL